MSPFFFYCCCCCCCTGHPWNIPNGDKTDQEEWFFVYGFWNCEFIFWMVNILLISNRIQGNHNFSIPFLFRIQFIFGITGVREWKRRDGKSALNIEIWVTPSRNRILNLRAFIEWISIINFISENQNHNRIESIELTSPWPTKKNGNWNSYIHECR